MNHSIRFAKTVFLSGAVTALLAVPAMAQPPGGGFGGGGFGGQGGPGGPGGMMRMMPMMVALDADGDGQISAEEIEKSAARLKTLDKNQDGKLTEEELRPNFEGREGRGPGGPGGGAVGPGGGAGGPGGGAGFGGGGFGGNRPITNGTFRAVLLVDGKEVGTRQIVVERDPNVPNDGIADELYELQLMEDSQNSQRKAKAKLEGKGFYQDN